VLPAVPPVAGVPADPEQALRARNDAERLALNAWTATPLWLGERLNVVYAIDVLHPRATGELRAHGRPVNQTRAGDDARADLC
jgi:hypothetical protein